MPNHLADESSPYLRQHADQPVDWYPWGERALTLAATTNKPILLSIGYSTCHWCHVMARESFSDADIAAVMNSHFVNIKVDREERPDLDKIYQTALQLIAPQGGGWPLTMFLDPHTRLPFFGGTYFPNQPRHQLPGFSDLLLRLSDVFANKQDELADQSAKLHTALDQLVLPKMAPSAEDQGVIDAARDQLAQQYDRQEGGFGTAPKFPMTHTLERLLNHWAYRRRNGHADREALDMVMTTLTKIARGGIHDHIGGGFCRYATDRRWIVPHFEKMLYDNARLISVFSQALKFGPDALFESAIRETIDWLTREMRHPLGAYYAALDADSEGAEGTFYVWRRDLVKKLLSEDEYWLIETLYSLDKPANFDGRWILYRSDSWRSVIERLFLDPKQATQHHSTAKAKLFEEREKRERPATDTKVLTAWNGLLVGAYADAAQALREPVWVTQAQEIVDFIYQNCWHEHRLYATWHGDHQQQPAFLDDYAYLLYGLLKLLQVQWRDGDVDFAQALAEGLLTNFYDHDQGGFFFTAHDHEALIHRPKPTMDDALPPGNGLAAQSLLRLGHLLANERYLDAAHNTLAWARVLMERVPFAHCTLVNVLEESANPGQHVILRGPADTMGDWIDELADGYTPWRQTYAIPYTGVKSIPDYLPKLVSAEQQERMTAYVCSGLQCSLPITDLADLKHQLTN